MAAVCASAAIAIARRSAASSSAPLKQPHLVQDRARDRAAPRGPAPLRARLSRAQREEIHHALVEGAVAAGREVEHGRVLDELRQALVELVDRVGRVGAVDVLRALDAGAAAGPDLLVLVARADEQRERNSVPGRSTQIASGSGKPVR